MSAMRKMVDFEPGADTYLTPPEGFKIRPSRVNTSLVLYAVEPLAATAVGVGVGGVGNKWPEVAWGPSTRGVNGGGEDDGEGGSGESEGGEGVVGG